MARAPTTCSHATRARCVCRRQPRVRARARAVAASTHIVSLPRFGAQATLVKAWKALGVLEKWQKSAWGKKLAARSAKAAQTDFDRFEVKVAKQKARKAAGKAAPAKAAKAKAVKA
jgi:ribosomal protein L14E/L6E/L27E